MKEWIKTETGEWIRRDAIDVIQVGETAETDYEVRVVLSGGSNSVRVGKVHGTRDDALAAAAALFEADDEYDATPKP